jgi:ribosome biogenesis GTPase A
MKKIIQIKQVCLLIKKYSNDLKRTNIGIFGLMNSGKSTLINKITKSEVSIVDSKAGIKNIF